MSRIQRCSLPWHWRTARTCLLHLLKCLALSGELATPGPLLPAMAKEARARVEDGHHDGHHDAQGYASEAVMRP